MQAISAKSQVCQSDFANSACFACFFDRCLFTRKLRQAAKAPSTTRQENSIWYNLLVLYQCHNLCTHSAPIGNSLSSWLSRQCSNSLIPLLLLLSSAATLSNCLHRALLCTPHRSLHPTNSSFSFSLSQCPKVSILIGQISRCWVCWVFSVHRSIGL